MRFEDEIYFSKRYQWSQIDIEDGLDLLEKFNDRICSLYIEPVEILLKEDAYYNSFAVGIILFSAIDFLGTFLTKYKGFKNKLEEFLIASNEYKDLDKIEKNQISKKITDCFRNGIIHNGRVKESCQFDYAFEEKLFISINDILIVNTKYLLALVNQVLSQYLKRIQLDNTVMKEFKDQFKLEFNSELEKLVN